MKYGHNGDISYNDGAEFTESQWETTFEYLREFGLMDRVFEPTKKVYGLYLNGKNQTFEDTGNLFESLLNSPWAPAELVAEGEAFLPNLLKDMSLVGEGHDFSGLAEISRLSTRE